MYTLQSMFHIWQIPELWLLTVSFQSQRRRESRCALRRPKLWQRKYLPQCVPASQSQPTDGTFATLSRRSVCEKSTRLSFPLRVLGLAKDRARQREELYIASVYLEWYFLYSLKYVTCSQKSYHRRKIRNEIRSRSCQSQTSHLACGPIFDITIHWQIPP